MGQLECVSCKHEQCSSCCVHDSDMVVQDLVARKSTAPAPGFRIHNGDSIDAGKISTDEDLACAATLETESSTMAHWPATGKSSVKRRPTKADVRETYEDGSTYDGQFDGGMRHGQGMWLSTGEAYEGEWKNDRRHGEGRQTWEDGRSYEGQFADAKFHGRGRMEWRTPQGMMAYEGEYVNDLKHGQGNYLWYDGSIYNGQWVNGVRSGKAMVTNPRGETQEGIFEEDKVVRWIADG